MSLMYISFQYKRLDANSPTICWSPAIKVTNITMNALLIVDPSNGDSAMMIARWIIFPAFIME